MGRLWLLSFFGGLMLSVGCTNSASTVDPTSNAPTATRGTIGVSLLTLQNPFFQVIGDNIQSEAEKHGFAVTVLSADEDVVKQGNQVKDFLVSGVSAIVLSPCQVEAIGPIIREANAAGVPVFTVDIPCRLPDVKIVSQIASDNYGGGEQAATGMIEALGEAGGKVAILHYQQAESCQLRVAGFRAKMEEHNTSGGARIEIVAELEGGGRKDSGAKTTEDLLQSHPDIAGIFAINDPSALGALAALEKAGKSDRVVLIGFDGQMDGKRAIQQGKIYGDPVQYPDKMGVEVVRAIVAHSNGEQVPAENLIPTSFYTKSDAENDPALK
jgi:ribose transport system substrate-binding protein